MLKMKSLSVLFHYCRYTIMLYFIEILVKVLVILCAFVISSFLFFISVDVLIHWHVYVLIILVVYLI